MLVLVRCVPALTILGLLLVSADTTPAPRVLARQSPASGVWGEVTVPGGARELLASAGLVTSIAQWRAVPAVIEQFYGGLNPRIPREFRSYGSRASKGADSSAPLPLGLGFWARVLKENVPPHQLLATILATRASASLYYGLLSMDTATLGAIDTDPALASVLIRLGERLPVHAKALRVRSGRMDLPGGDSFGPLWTDLAGPPDRPALFIETLLTKDDGRLGYFYNTVDALPAPALRFVGGTTHTSLDERRKRFQALYHVFAASLPTWDGPERRFFPIRGGPASALFDITVREDGSIVGPPWLDVWKRALTGHRTRTPLDIERMADAADLLALLCPGGRCDEEKVRTLTFVQRQPGAGSREHAGLLIEAARTRRHYPALALELERFHLDDLQIYATADEIARRIDSLPREHRPSALAQFQAAVSLLRRLRAGGLPAPDVRRQLGSLFSLPLHRDGYRGGVLRWFAAEVLGTTTEIDEAALRALAGVASSGATVEWEGLRYRVDITATELQRIRTTRANFKGHDLSSAWALLAAGDRRAERAAAEAIVALVYSMIIQDDGSPLALSRELPLRHDFFGRLPGESLPPAWTLGSVRLAPGSVRHLGGSLLALESGAPELASRRLGADRPPDRARISPVLADGLLRTAALTSLWADTTDEGSRIVVAAERGAALAGDPLALDGALRSAGIAGPRAGWIRWAIARGEPAPASVLRLEDLVRLGDSRLAVPSIGAAAMPLACVCLQWPDITWEMRGQPPDHFLAAALSVEAPLRVAYELRTRNLPNVLAHGVLALVMSDLVQAGALAHPADVHGIADTVRRMPGTRFDDYIAAVAARGPLVPVSSGGGAN